MKKYVDAFVRWIYRLVASTKFFVFTVVLLAVQAAWLALSAVYPLPFDEYVHVGSIQIYAKQWLPFIAEQPASASIYGDITREPSFLYYWIMSFPYRFFELFTDNEMALIIMVRLVNVAFVVGGLILFRKLLLTWGLSRRVTHIALLAFVATPVIPFLAAHVNYDNLMFLLAPLFLLAATRLITDDKDLIRRIMLFGFLGATTVLIKRTFLPLAAIVVIYVAVVIWRRDGAKIAKKVSVSWRKTRKGWSFAALCFGLVLAAGLFAERYGGNMLQYGSVWPRCQEVQSREVCADFGPWYRDNVAIAWLRPAQPLFGNPVSFTQFWVTKVMDGYYVLFSHYAGAEPQPGDPYGGITGAGLLPLPIKVGWAALAFGTLAVLYRVKRIWRNRYLRFALITAAGYLFATWAFNYKGYLNIGRPIAVQARYTYPVLIVLFALMIQAGSWSLDNLKHKISQLKSAALLVFLATYVWGGGVAGWIIRAPDSWRWQNSVVQTVNSGAANVLRYFVLH